MLFGELIKARLELIVEFVRDEIKRELEQQGHRASGKLIDTIQTNVVIQGQSVIGKVLMQDYSRYLDTGTKPHFPPISALLDWAKNVKPGATQKELRSFAFAVQKTIGKEGTPTKGSFAFSKNGRRKNWSEYAIVRNKSKIRQILNLEGLIKEQIKILGSDS